MSLINHFYRARIFSFFKISFSRSIFLADTVQAHLNPILGMVETDSPEKKV